MIQYVHLIHNDNYRLNFNKNVSFIYEWGKRGETVKYYIKYVFCKKLKINNAPIMQDMYDYAMCIITHC